MAPVVDRLEEIYRGQVELRRMDAKSTDGNNAFNAFKLPGHPGFVLLNPEGEILWKGFGIQPEEIINQQLNKALAGM